MAFCSLECILWYCESSPALRELPGQYQPDCSVSCDQSTGVFSNRVLSTKFRWPTKSNGNSLYCSGGLANLLRGDFPHLTLEFWTSIIPCVG